MKEGHARVGKVLSWLGGPTTGREDQRVVRALYLRLLGFIYLLAFASLGSQILGLVGSHGILPMQLRLTAITEFAAQHPGGGSAYWWEPTLGWFNASDGFLQFQCWAGAVLSLILIGGLAPAVVLPLLWLLYLSLVTAGQVFTGYQWDNLLLEAGFLAIGWAPWARREPLRGNEGGSRLFLWLHRWLLFRLMWGAGVVKLASGDPSWSHLTALSQHFETQPLPTWIAWYAHQIPGEWLRVATALMFVIELVIPFFILGPRRLRLLAFWSFAGLQVAILLTGNYGFFNLLTLVLCLVVLDDAVLLGAVERVRTWLGLPQPKIPSNPGIATPGSWMRWPRGLRCLAALIVIPCSLMQLPSWGGVRVAWPSPLEQLRDWVSPLRSINSYGLFAVMTRTRPELIIEGSRDGLEWRAYGFHSKPGDPARRPTFVAPYQPRLDWQMWFAALGTPEDNPWCRSLARGLLQGEPAIVKFFRDNPFSGDPPRYLRFRLYRYRFTNPSERGATGDWWKAELRGGYGDVFSLRP